MWQLLAKPIWTDMICDTSGPRSLRNCCASLPSVLLSVSYRCRGLQEPRESQSHKNGKCPVHELTRKGSVDQPPGTLGTHEWENKTVVCWAVESLPFTTEASSISPNTVGNIHVLLHRLVHPSLACGGNFHVINGPWVLKIARPVSVSTRQSELPPAWTQWIHCAHMHPGTTLKSKRQTVSRLKVKF